jgi:hypothetical protein
VDSLLYHARIGLALCILIHRFLCSFLQAAFLTNVFLLGNGLFCDAHPGFRLKNFLLGLRTFSLRKGRLARASDGSRSLGGS